MAWRTCVEKNIAKRVSVDEQLIKSLLESSANKRKSAQLLKLSTVTASSRVTLSYDAIREVIEALALKEGYKIYNHECYTSFLDSVLRKEELSAQFDRLRKIRNSINYYGKQLSVADAEELEEEIDPLLDQLKEML